MPKSIIDLCKEAGYRDLFAGGAGKKPRVLPHLQTSRRYLYYKEQGRGRPMGVDFLTFNSHEDYDGLKLYAFRGDELRMAERDISLLHRPAVDLDLYEPIYEGRDVVKILEALAKTTQSI